MNPTAEEVTEDNSDELLSDCHGILVPGGFGDRGIEGKIEAIRYARVNKKPFLGICLGMQMMSCYKKDVNLIKNDTFINHKQESDEELTHKVKIKKDDHFVKKDHLRKRYNRDGLNFISFDFCAYLRCVA